ncbi:MAG: ATP-binding cassette domain-containing protein [Lachnospiraceae bacterium]|nr:ATP-binding cassette domain-containing protein [Lachnospiraceae bacterium]
MTIQIENVCKSAGGQEILKNVNWDISSDDCFLLTGPAKSGKTLLLRLILGLEKPDSGSVNLLGDYKYASVNAGVVFQEDRLCEQFSAIENVAMVNARLSEAVAEEELVKFLPQERLTIPVSELDPVERRLVVMIRACIVPSDLLLLDEPLRGMDEALARKVIAYIREKAGHKGIVFAQRDDRGLEFCRKFVL